MAKRKQPQGQPGDQPRALALPVQPSLFRAGLHLELQKFGDPERDLQASQLILTEIVDEAKAPQLEVSGLDLTVSEAKALQALQKLLDRTNYKGNIPGQEVHSEAFKWSGTLPRLSLTYSEYFEAYGLQQAGDQYQGLEREQALEALDSLASQWRICYEREEWTGEGKGRKRHTTMIATDKPLISILKGYKDLDDEEAAQVRAGLDIPGRVVRLEIEFSPLLVDQIETFHTLKPYTLYQDIQQLLGPRRISRAVFLFVDWLLTVNINPLPIAKKKLAIRLRLSKEMKERHWDRIEARFQEAFETAKELGILLDYKEDLFGILHFELNPEMCSRLRAKHGARGSAKAADEEAG